MTTRPSNGEPAQGSGGSRGAREIIELVGLVIAPATLLTALLFYFGWTRSRAQAAYFGVDADLLGRSSQEYVLRSISSIFWPLTLLLVGMLLALAAHAGAKKLADTKHVHLLLVLAACGLVAGASLIIFAVLGVVWRPRAGGGAVLTPAAFAVGIPVAAYALFLAFSVASKPGASHLDPLPRAELWLIAGLFCVFTFWTVGNYANFRGRTLAERTATHLNRLPSVIVYSRQRIYLEGWGVEETALNGSNAAYHFRYTGLKLLARAGNRSFLLPNGWCRTDRNQTCHHNGVAFVLQDDPALRLDFAP